MSDSDPTLPSNPVPRGDEKDSEDSTEVSLSECPVCGQGQRTADPDDPCPRCALTASLEQSRADPQKLTGDAVGGLRIEPEGVGEEARYRVGDRIAHGGMGEILEAREVPIGRRVAMKVIHDGMREDPEVRQRFIEEAQITGQLEHPSIVPMHDLSIDDRGHVFYTMKKVEGHTLASILSRLRKGEKEALRDFSLIRLLTAFQKICDAVAFAHSRGVIHRDLKPANVMIGQFGEVLVMDWGIARVVNLPELEVTIQDLAPDSGEPDRSIDGSVLGTIGYMPPEQAEGNREAIGFHSDIYALGAILYEILTLRRTVEAKSPNEALKQIRSGKIVPITSATARGTTGKTKGAVIPKHCPGQRIPASLAAVAMKALKKDPEDRYGSVEELQHEIEAYQGGFATEAENASFGRHLKLFVRRHKGASLAAAIIAALLVVGIVVSDQLRRRAVAAEEAAALAQENAENALSETEATAEFLSEVIRTPVPDRERVETISYSELVDHARTRLENASNLSPVSRLRLEWTFGEALYTAGRVSESVQHLESVRQTADELLVPGDPLSLTIDDSLALRYLNLNRIEDSIAIRERLVASHTVAEGRDGPNALRQRGHLAFALSRIGRKTEALELMEEVHAAAQRGSASPALKRGLKMQFRALLFEFQDREHLERSLRLAEELYEETTAELGKESYGATELFAKVIETRIALGTANDPELVAEVEDFLVRRRKRFEDIDHPMLMKTLMQAGDFFEDNGDQSRALELWEEALPIARIRNFRDPGSVGVATNVAVMYRDHERTDEAIELLESVREASRSWPKVDRALATTNVVRYLAGLYVQKGRVSEALQLAIDSVEFNEGVLGSDDPRTLSIAIFRARLEMNHGSLETAAELTRELAARDWEGRQLSQWDYLRLLQGEIAAKQGDLIEAIRLSEEPIANLLEFHSGRAVAANAGLFYLVSSWYEKAEQWEEKLAFEERALNSSHGENLKIALLLRYASSLVELGRFDECLAPGMEWFALWKEKFPDINSMPQDRVFGPGSLCWRLRQAGHLDESVEVGQKALEVYRIKLGETFENTLWVTDQLWLAYRANQQLPEARALIEETVGLLEKHRPEDTELIETWKAKRKP